MKIEMETETEIKMEMDTKTVMETETEIRMETETEMETETHTDEEREGNTCKKKRQIDRQKTDSPTDTMGVGCFRALLRVSFLFCCLPLYFCYTRHPSAPPGIVIVTTKTVGGGGDSSWFLPLFGAGGLGRYHIQYGRGHQISLPPGIIFRKLDYRCCTPHTARRASVPRTAVASVKSGPAGINDHNLTHNLVRAKRS